MLNQIPLPFFSPDEGGGGDSGSGGDANPVQAPAPHWTESLPDDMKGNTEVITPWKDKSPADLFKAHVELTGKVKNAIIPPGEGATEEEVKAFADRMRVLNQVPEKPDGYELKLPEGVPKDDPLLVSVVNKAHEAGLSAKGIQAAIDGFLEYVTNAETQASAVIEQHKAALKIELGSGYDQAVKDAESTMRIVGEEAGYTNEDIVKQLEATGLKNNPMFLKMFLKIHRFYKEGKLEGQGSKGPASRSPEAVAKSWYPGMK